MTTRGRTLTGRIRHWYGANPLHLLALLAAFALAGYAVRAVIAAGQLRGFAIWFAVAIVGHDLLLFPLYTVADLSVQRLLPWKGRRAQAGPPAAGQVPGPPLINYVRIPVAFSLLLLLVFFPLILGLSEPGYHRASGLTTHPYLWRWLAVTGVLFAASAVIYALRWRRAAAGARKQQAALAALAALAGPRAPESPPVPPAPEARTTPPATEATQVPSASVAEQMPQAAPARDQEPPPAARDVPPSAPPAPGFDVWAPRRDPGH